MPATPSYIPARDIDFDAWLLNFSTLLTASPTTYGLVAGDATAVAAAYTAWHDAFIDATTPGTRTPVTVATKDTERINATVIVRPLAQRIAVNPAVDNGDKVAIGVNPRGTVPTPIPAPLTFPVLVWLGATPGVIQLAYKDSSLGATKKKPFGAIAMELWVGYAATTPPPLVETNFVGNFTKSPLVLDTTGNAGKAVSIYARWVTRSGPAGVAQVGPWSVVLPGTVV
jgi:hypothetical protein